MTATQNPPTARKPAGPPPDGPAEAAKRFLARNGAELARLLTLRESVFTRAEAEHLLAHTQAWSAADAGDPAADGHLRDAILDQFLDANPAVLRYKAHRTAKLFYTTAEMAQLEDRLFAQAKRWSQVRGNGLKTDVIDWSLKMFAADPNVQEMAGPGGIDAELFPALRAQLGDGRIHLLGGPPGAGKSTLAAGLVLAYEKVGTPILMTGPSDVITAEIAIETKSDGVPLTELLTQVRAGRSPIKPNSVLVVDEAGMVGSRQMAELFDEIKAKNARLYLIGDPKQIGPKEAGHPFRYFADALPITMLSQVHRQKFQDDKVATKAIWDGQGGAAVRSYEQRGRIEYLDDADHAIKAAAKDYARWKAEPSHAGRTGLVLCLDFATAKKANAAVRHALKKVGLLQNSQSIQTNLGPLEIALGERVQFFENVIGQIPAPAGGPDLPHKIYKGNSGVVVKMDANAIHVKIDGWKEMDPVRVPLDPQMRLNYGYAMELRRVQGITVHRAFNVFTRRLEAGEGLVALSRHKHKATVFCDKAVYPDAEALISDFERKRLKLMSNDLKTNPEWSRLRR